MTQLLLPHALPRRRQPTCTVAPPAPSTAAACAAAGLQPARLPRHVALILDGNSRWASARSLPALEGHRRGAARLLEAVRCCASWGVPSLTAFAFSTDNWRRPAEEVGGIFAVIEGALTRQVVDEFTELGVRLSAVGDLQALPLSLQRVLQRASEATRDGSVLHLQLLLNYSGRSDILAATRALAQAAAAGTLRPADIDDAAFEAVLAATA